MVRPASGCADKTGMRRTSVALVALTAGLAATAAVRRLVARRRSGQPQTLPVPLVVEPPVPADDAVVLPFARRTASAPAAERPAASPVRCGENGGRTKAGAPCAARATSGGRCHHHRLAA
jgi:hypothetical protein